ncbi:MAG: hypothetical protein GTO14_21570 [Anaerolineales bacterium]|nr:hypothetical protein [Anaerolineales bacterium]
MTLDLDSANTFVRLIQDTASVIAAAMADQAASRQAEVWRAVEETVSQQFGQPDGSIHMPNQAICVVGRCDGREA